MAIDTLAWHQPVDVSEVKRALEIERELGRERTLDDELILEESRALEPAGDVRHGSRSDELLQPKSKQ